MHGISDDLWFIRSQTPAAMGPVQHRVSHTSSCSRRDVEGPAAWEGVSDGWTCQSQRIALAGAL